MNDTKAQFDKLVEFMEQQAIFDLNEIKSFFSSGTKHLTKACKLFAVRWNT